MEKKYNFTGDWERIGGTSSEIETRGFGFGTGTEATCLGRSNSADALQKRGEWTKQVSSTPAKPRLNRRNLSKGKATKGRKRENKGKKMKKHSFSVVPEMQALAQIGEHSHAGERGTQGRGSRLLWNKKYQKGKESKKEHCERRTYRGDRNK